MPSGKWWQMEEEVKELNITEEEQEKLDELYIGNRRRMIDIKGAVEIEQLEFETLLEKKELDEKAVRAQFRKLHDARGEMSEVRFGFILEVRKLLGYDRFQQLKSKFKRRGRQGMRSGGRGPAGGQQRQAP